MIAIGNVQSSESLYNFLINGGMNFFQRTPPGIATNRSGDSYGPDRWVCLTQTGACAIRRQPSTSTYPFVSHNFLELDSSSAQKTGIAQIVEAQASIPLRGQKCMLTFAAQGGEGAISCAILEHTGTVDVVTSDVVNDWTNLTYTTGNFFGSYVVSQLLHLNPVTSTGSVSRFYLPFTPTVNVNNLIVFVWLTAAPAVSAIVRLGDFSLYRGSTQTIFAPRLMSDEQVLCERYFEKSYFIDIPPGTASDNDGLCRSQMPSDASPGAHCWIPFRVAKRIIPTVTPYAFNGDADNWNEQGSATSTAATVNVASRNSCIIRIATVPAARGINGQYAADAEL